MRRWATMLAADCGGVPTLETEHPTPRTQVLGLLWYISPGNLAEHNPVVYKEVIDMSSLATDQPRNCLCEIHFDSAFTADTPSQVR